MKPLEKWECGECGELHDDDDEARDCCRPRIYEVYQCPVCYESHSDIDKAISCIDEHKESGDARLYMAEKAELEKQGQTRLF